MDLKQRYGRLTVMGRKERVGNNYRVRVCCDCGVETYVWVHNLKSGATQSCGCLKAEQYAERLKRRAAERARELTDRIEAEKRLKKLKKLISKVASESETLRKITNGVEEIIDAIAEEIKAEAEQEYNRKQQPLQDLLDDGFMPRYVFNRDVSPLWDERIRVLEDVTDEVERLKSMWRDIRFCAYRKGKKAMLCAGVASEALFSRVRARSLLVALRKLDADCGGEIAQRLFAPLQSVQELLRWWLAANRRERTGRLPSGSAGVVLSPVSASVSSPVTVE